MAACTDTSRTTSVRRRLRCEARPQRRAQWRPVVSVRRTAGAVAHGEIPVSQLHRTGQRVQSSRARSATARGQGAPEARPIRRRTVCERLSAESGFWKTICSDFSCSRPRAGSRARVPRPVRCAARIGRRSPNRSRASVVLPLPDSPTSPSVSPAQRSNAHSAVHERLAPMPKVLLSSWPAQHRVRSCRPPRDTVGARPARSEADDCARRSGSGCAASRYRRAAAGRSGKFLHKPAAGAKMHPDRDTPGGKKSRNRVQPPVVLVAAAPGRQRINPTV